MTPTQDKYNNNRMPNHNVCGFFNRPVNYINLNDFNITTKCTSTGGNNDAVFSQSPIPLNTNECFRLPPPIHICLCNHFERKTTSVRVQNNGLTAMVTFPELAKQPTLKGGPLKDEFRFEQLHFHWSDCDEDGSEHSIDGRKFACEAHLVHYNTKYESFEIAQNEKDGLVVIGVMLEICDEDNLKLDPLINALYRIPCKSSEYIYTSSCFFDWLENADFNEYVTYNGSLTTDPFNETVYWIVLTKPISISKSQMLAFRNMHVYQGKKRVKTNARELQFPPVDHKVRYTGKLKFKTKL